VGEPATLLIRNSGPRVRAKFGRLFLFFERRRQSALQYGLGVDAAKVFDQTSDDAGPSGLLAGADAGAIVAVEVFVEQQVVAPLGIALRFLRRAKDRPEAGFIAQKDPGQAISDLLRHLEQVHQSS